MGWACLLIGSLRLLLCRLMNYDCFIVSIAENNP
jgi:hypothetical protein